MAAESFKLLHFNRHKTSMHPALGDQLKPLRLPSLGETLERALKPEIIDYVAAVIAIAAAISTALFSGGYIAAILLCFIGALAYAYARKVRACQKLASTLGRQHDAYVACIKNMNAMFSEFVEGGRSEHRSAHLGLFVNRLKDVFDDLSNTNQSAVCIKLLVSKHSRPQFDGSYIWTAKRDDESYRDRGKFDDSRELRRYRPRDNKAFVDILSPDVHKDHFFSNDLKSMTDYYNANHLWQNYYNATVVVPIKPSGADIGRTIGFLCVDSLNGIFDEDVSVAILTLVAEMMFRHLKSAESIPEPLDLDGERNG